MKALKLFVSSVLLSSLSFLFFESSVSAQGVNDFVFETFQARFELDNSDPQGAMRITEYMEVDFSGQNRGILRAIPNKYQGFSLNLEVLQVERDGAEEQFTTYDQNDNTVLQIGNPSVYITGKHSYTIEYRVENVIRFYDSHDELYWDINGDQWGQPFNSVVVELQTDATLRSGMLACYTGVSGSTDQICDITGSPDGLRSATTQRLGPRETLTIIAGFEKGYFTPMNFWERNRDLLIALPFVAGFLSLVGVAYRRWLREGRDLPGRGVVVPYFGRPKDVSVLQAAYVYHQKFDTKDVTAMIIDLAIRGHIKIIENNKSSHSLKLIKKRYNELSNDEILLLEILFPKQIIGETLSLKKSERSLYMKIYQLKNIVDKQSNEHLYFEISPIQSTTTQGLPIGVIFATIIVTLFLPIPGLTKMIVLGSGIVSLMIVITLVRFMVKRGRKGVELKEHMDGLKLYLDKAEKDRIRMHDAVEAPLAKNIGSGQPEWTREFFEKLLPFAVVFGVDKSWGKAFEGVYEQPPEWYQGNWKTFSTVSLVNGITSASKHATSSFTPPSSSSSSGFSGGGSSGGGGGGGGGGGW